MQFAADMRGRETSVRDLLSQQSVIISFLQHILFLPSHHFSCDLSDFGFLQLQERQLRALVSFIELGIAPLGVQTASGALE